MIDLEDLLTARLCVARLGELDVHQWWPTDGILGLDGGYVGPRVLPRTHATGRARIAFAVARRACDERHPAEGVQHLFRLDTSTEDRFETYLMANLGNTELWGASMSILARITKEAQVSEVLRLAGVASERTLTDVAKVALGPGGRSLPLPSVDVDGIVDLLTAGFVRSEPGRLAVPVMQAEG